MSLLATFNMQYFELSNFGRIIDSIKTQTLKNKKHECVNLLSQQEQAVFPYFCANEKTAVSKEEELFSNKTPPPTKEQKQSKTSCHSTFIHRHYCL